MYKVIHLVYLLYNCQSAITTTIITTTITGNITNNTSTITTINTSTITTSCNVLLKFNICNFLLKKTLNKTPKT